MRTLRRYRPGHDFRPAAEILLPRIAPSDIAVIDGSGGTDAWAPPPRTTRARTPAAPCLRPGAGRRHRHLGRQPTADPSSPGRLDPGPSPSRPPPSAPIGPSLGRHRPPPGR